MRRPPPHLPHKHHHRNAQDEDQCEQHDPREAQCGGNIVCIYDHHEVCAMLRASRTSSPAVATPPASSDGCSTPARPNADMTVPMSADYSAIVDAMKKSYDVRVRKWRRSISGVAWPVHYHD